MPTWWCCVIQADNHQENLVVAEAKKIEADGLVNFITINEVRYITEYNQVVSLTQFQEIELKMRRAQTWQMREKTHC